jgi:Ca-activated chloride channel family protein
MKFVRVFAALLGILLFVSFAQAQGIILPGPCTRPIQRCPQPTEIPQQPLKVKSIKLTTKINDQVAVTHVEQVFENDTPFVLEGVYFFPLPDNVSISEFAMWDGDKRLVGEVRSRDEARRIYDNIVRSRRDPALLEYAGKNLFQASVFPIQPHSDKKIELSYSQILTGENGAVNYRYPLGTGWRANQFLNPPPRPIRRDGTVNPTFPPRTTSSRISAHIEIVSSVPLKGIYSPSHDLEIKRDSERKAKISFETSASSEQKDFQLFYNFSAQDFGASLLTYREPGKDGYFMLIVSPQAELDDRNVAARDVIFVVDTSGSMSEDAKMEKARSALRYGVNTLKAKDRFNIVSFAGEEHLLNESLLQGNDEGKRRAMDFIDRMKATGGTNINDALLSALKQANPGGKSVEGGRTQIVVLITDGQPTVGETQPKRILENVRQANKTQIRLFTFGVGYDVNTLLLDGLASENRGAVGYIEPNEDLEVKVSDFFAKVNHPVLSDVKISWGGAQTDLVYPRITPDIFHGSQLVLIGRYSDEARQKLRVTLTGNVNGRERKFVYDDLSFPEKQTNNDFLAHLWAMRRVGHLLDQIRSNGESKELRDEIIQLGTRYGIVTPYTSYLVLEPGMRLAGTQGTTNLTMDAQGSGVGHQPRVSPSKSAPMMLPDTAISSGRDAVLISKEKEKLSRADKIETSEIAIGGSMRQVAGKTFYLLNGVWTDSEFKEESKLPVVSLKFGSDDYFQLIGREPKLAEYFSLGERVVVIWDSKVYKVEP